MDKLVYNSPEYWSWRYASGDWENAGGNLQQASFAKSLINELPQEIKNDINGMSVCDCNCALSASLPVFQEAFPGSKIYGIDFVQEAIDKSKEYFPQFKYSLKLDKNYGCCISSNSLEHIKEWKSVLKNYIDHADKYVIIMVPYSETLVEPYGEHVVSFTQETFPDKIGKFKKVFIKTFKSEWWLELQMVIIYKK